MAGTGVKLRVETDDERVRAALGRLVRTLDNPKPVMDEIGAHLESSTVRRFEAERGPNGRAWKPSKRARKQGGKTLSDTGRLCASITRRASRREVAVGTNVLYAAIHQFGGKIEKQAPFSDARLPRARERVRIEAVHPPEKGRCQSRVRVHRGARGRDAGAALSRSGRQGPRRDPRYRARPGRERAGVSESILSGLTYLDAVAARLEESGLYGDVVSALDFTTAKQRTLKPPAAIVTPAGDTGAKSAGGGVRRIEALVAVTTVVEVVNDPGGGRSRDALTPLVDRGRAALIGWRPGERDDALELESGALIDLDQDQGRAWWEDVYRTGRWI